MERDIQSELPQKPLEATYVTILKDMVHKKIPEHEASFGIALDEINKQITGEGLFQWESKDQPGVKVLMGHLSITPDLIHKIADQNSQDSEKPFQEPDQEGNTQRLEHYAYFLQPTFGIPPDGSGLSALDLGIDRFIKEMPKVARAIRTGEKPPTVDIYLFGGPTGLGAEVTPEFVDSVRASGFSEYGKLYAEFVNEYLPKDKDTLDKTRVVLYGISKGTVTADQTYFNLPDIIKSRTQLLFDSTAASHGSNLPTQIGRGINMGLGMGAEIGLRMVAGSVKAGQFSEQPKFYQDILKIKGIPEESDEQKKLKTRLWLSVSDFWAPIDKIKKTIRTRKVSNLFAFNHGSELKNIAHGTPLDPNVRAYSRISTPDPVNINFTNLLRVNFGKASDVVIEKSVDALRRIPLLAGRMEPKPRRALFAKSKGEILTFATGNNIHNFPWVRSVDSGSWAQKMEYVENTKAPKESS